MRIPQLRDNAVNYNLAVDSISSWDDFLKVFLNKFCPIYRTALITKHIMQFRQDSNEPFWKDFEHFKDILA